MKISLDVNQLFRIFPQYEKELSQLNEEYIQILENHNFKLDQIKDKTIKSIFEIQLGTKEDFNFQVILEDNIWKIKDYSAHQILPLLLRGGNIVFDWEEKSLDLSEESLLEYLEKTYRVNALMYEGINYVGEGKINWTTITKDVKENWDNSFFFLENMNNEQFVENNKELILEKIKDNDELLKEAMIKSALFFKYALKNIPSQKLLIILSEKEGYLAEIWNSKIKDIFKKSDFNLLLKEAQEQVNEELENYWEFMTKSSYNKYGEYNDYQQYDKIKDRLLKDLKSREKEIKKEVEINQKSIEEIHEILENKQLKINIIKGLLKNDIFNEDFKLFEKEIINHEELRNLVIKRGLFKTLAVTKAFVESLNEKEFLEFSQNCNNKLGGSLFRTDDKRHFNSIVSEEQLLNLLRKEENLQLKWDILLEYKTKNKELKKYIFKTNPKELFGDLSKSEIDNEDIKLYIKAGGYLNTLKEKVNIYQITDIETIKTLCEKHNEILGNKKTPIEWKTNPEIIRAALLDNSSLEDTGLSKENVIQLSKDINFVKEVVSQDKSNSFYRQLPEKLKNNRQVALSLLEANEEIENVIKVLPGFILLDKRFNIELIKYDASAIKYLKESLWDDKEFVLTLFNELKNTDKEKIVKKYLPDKIKLFLETFNIENNYYTFFNNYYLQKKLKENLINEEIRPKEKKLKI